MLATRNSKVILAAVLLLLLGSSVFWMLRQADSTPSRRPAKAASGSNPALDLRYTYDASVLRPASYDGTAEFPLRLDGDGFSFYGKRIRGAGTILAKEPGPILYDFVGSQHAEVFEFWYKLEPAGEPRYEDVTLQGRLGLHQVMEYRRTTESTGWPLYFPDSIRGELQEDGTRSSGTDTAYIEGWALFSSEDLFFFYAVSAVPLTTAQRETCEALINSVQFKAVGSDEAAAQARAEEEKRKASEPKKQRPQVQMPEREDPAAENGADSGDPAADGN